MEDSNIIIIESNDIIIDDVIYKFNEDENGMWLTYDKDGESSIIKIENGFFVIDGCKYAIVIDNDDSIHIYRVLNINNAIVCFGEFLEGQNCGFIMDKLTSYDKEDGELEVKLKEVLYSIDGKSYTETDQYDIGDVDSLFSLKSIKFKQIGYYKFVFISIDTKENFSEVEYVVKVEDTTPPTFEYKGEKVESSSKVEDFEYTEDFVNDFKNLPGNGETAKIKTYLEKWIEKNVELVDNYIADKYEIVDVTIIDDLDYLDISKK